MKQLAELVKGCNLAEIKGNPQTTVTDMVFDSRRATRGCLFAAITGTNTDGHAFIDMAIAEGATAILCNQLPEGIEEGVTYVLAPDTAETFARMVSNFFDNPSGELNLVGITGTNGKTTTVTLLYRVFRKLGYKTGLISTVRNCIDDVCHDASLTTPDPVELNRFLRAMVDKGCRYAFMEVSSHAIAQNRIAGLTFRGGIFSNITHDHLDYHKTFDEYLRAKKLFFDNLPHTAFALVNADDRNGKVMVQNCKAPVKYYALKKLTDFHARILESHFEGMQLVIDNQPVWVKLIGEFNAYNLMAVYGCCLLLGADRQEVLTIISGLDTVDGRFEYQRSADGVTAIIDYAHTPDALENVLDAINQIRRGGEQLISVVGAGGNRDKTKRPKMARVAVDRSDKVILTSDNPRFEEPMQIIEDMQKGIDPSDNRKYLVIADRKEAIRTACMLARTGDIILIAGKGHETYQDIKGVKHHFNDKEIVSEFFMLNKTNMQ